MNGELLILLIVLFLPTWGVYLYHLAESRIRYEYRRRH
jgi:hypothetical protein